MKTTVYLLMTILLGILSFSQSEARIIDPSAEQTVATPSWKVTIPVNNNLIIAKKGKEPNDVLMQVSTTRGRIQKSNGQSKSSSSQIPKQDKSQFGDQGNIFDRWGNSKNTRTK